MSHQKHTLYNHNSNESFKHDQENIYELAIHDSNKDQMLEVPSHQPNLFHEPNFSSYHENYNLKPTEDDLKTSMPFKAGMPVIEPICIKTDINTLQESCPTAIFQQNQVDFKQAVPCHQQQTDLKPAANTAPTNDSIDETLESFLKDYITNGPTKDRFQQSMPDACIVDPQCLNDTLPESKSSNIIPSNLNLASENPLESSCEPFPEFLAPQQRAPRAISRSNSRESQALVKSDRSSNNGSSGNSCFNDSLCFTVNPSYSVTEWLQTGYRSGSGQSLSSQFSLTSITRGKKRALSNSPLSIDGIDLNSAIRTSPTSLVAFINGSPCSSLSPAFGGKLSYFNLILSNLL